MKRLILNVFLVFIVSQTICKAQIDTTKFTICDLTFKGGFFFPNNTRLQNKYNSKSDFNWTIEMSFGNSNSKIIPWIGYSHSKLTLDTVKDIRGITIDSSFIASKRQILFGLITPVKLSSNDLLLLKWGISYNFIKETTSNLNSEPFGFLVSLGYLRKVSKIINSVFEIGYDYTRVNKSDKYREWSGLKISIGLSLNLGAVNWTEFNKGSSSRENNW